MEVQNLPKMLSIKQASVIFGIPEWTLRSYISKRLIPYRKLRRRVYLPTEKFQSWLSRFDIEPIGEEGKR